MSTTNSNAIPSLAFTKSWTSAADFPTYEDSETKVRADLQELHDQTKTYINEQLVPAVQGFVDEASPKLEQAHDHANKTLLDSYDQTNEAITDAVTKKHAHANKSALDTIPSGGVSNDKAETSATKIPTCAAVRGAIDEAVLSSGNLPSGGSDGQVLTKKTNANYDTQWSSVPPVGTVLMWAGASDAVPSGYLLCDGAAVSRTEYAALFSTLGTAFGVGDGSTTFSLPDLRARFVFGANSTYTRGETGGEVNHTLTASEMPVHSHSCSDGGSHTHTMESGGEHTHSSGASGTISVSKGDGTSGTSTVGKGGTADTGSAGLHTHELGTASDHTHSIGNVGGGNAHNNMPPYIALAYIIRAR